MNFTTFSTWWAAQVIWLFDGPCLVIQFLLGPVLLQELFLKRRIICGREHGFTLQPQVLHCYSLIWIYWRLNIAFPLAMSVLYDLI